MKGFAVVLLAACGGTPSHPIEPPNQHSDTGTSDTDADTAHATDTGQDRDTGEVIEQPSFQVSLSTDLSRAAGNPLRGFYTNYDWGTPTRALPASLEFAYIPLRELMDGPNSFTFESGLEPRLLAAESRGHQLVIRPYIDYPAHPTGLPEYLREEVSMSAYADHGGGHSPDYFNPALQEAILAFINALGTRYDGDPRLGVVQLGLLGFWGEWHTWPHTDWFPDDHFQSEVLQAYVTAFQTTLLQVRYPYVESPTLPVGFHDDSFAYSTVGDTGWFFVPSMEAAGAEQRWREVPIGGELRPELQSEIFKPDYVVGEYSQDFTTCVQATHASMLLNYRAFQDAGETEAEVAAMEAGANALGYAYHLDQVTLEEGQLTLTVENQGVAPFYPPLSVTVIDASGLETTLEVPPLFPDEPPTELVLDVAALLAPTRDTPWTIALHSPQVLPAQSIRFASTTDAEFLRVQ